MSLERTPQFGTVSLDLTLLLLTKLTLAPVAFLHHLPFLEVFKQSKAATEIPREWHRPAKLVQRGGGVECN